MGYMDITTSLIKSTTDYRDQVLRYNGNKLPLYQY